MKVLIHSYPKYSSPLSNISKSRYHTTIKTFQTKTFTLIMTITKKRKQSIRFRKSRFISKTSSSFTSNPAYLPLGLQGRATECKHAAKHRHSLLDKMPFPPSSSRSSPPFKLSLNKIERLHRSKLSKKHKTFLYHKFLKSLHHVGNSEFPHLPIIVMSRHFVSIKLGFDNCIILDNARIVKNDANRDILTYDPNPYWIGRNIQSLQSPIQITQVKHKKIFLLARYHCFVKNNILPNNNFHMYRLDDNGCFSMESSLQDFILISSIGNEAQSNVDSSCLVDDSFLSNVHAHMKVNVRGDGKKHFNSLGKYYGSGIVAKYKIEKNMSFGMFAQKKGKCVLSFCYVILSSYI